MERSGIGANPVWKKMNRPATLLQRLQRRNRLPITMIPAADEGRPFYIHQKLFLYMLQLNPTILF